MTTGIRIEHPSDGCGIFAEYKKWGPDNEVLEGRDSEVVFDLYDDKLNNMFVRHKSFRNPIEDGLDFKRNVHFCAFKSVEQMQEWIKQDELSYIVSKGYRIYKLELSDCQIGRDNVIFKKQCIKTKIDITDIFVNEN